MTGRAVVVADVRSMPVSVVRHDDVARIAEVFDGRKLPVARSVYFAVVQLVAEAGDIYGMATRKDLATLAGVSVRTLDENVAALVEAELLHVVKRREDGLNLPNLYALGPPPGGGAARDTTAASCTSAADDTQRSSSSPTASSPKKDDGGARAALPLPDDPSLPELPDDLLADAAELVRRKTKVDGRLVTGDEMVRAAHAIAEFNRQAGSDFGLGAHLRAVVMRIRERPSYDTAAHVRLVQSAWRIRWWERNGRGRRPTPAVIYGNSNVFEQVVQDAVDEKAGRKIDDGPQRRARFTRED